MAPSPSRVSGAKKDGASLLWARLGRPSGLGQVRLSRLSFGERFDLKTTSGIEEITGAFISRAGLTKLYAACLPGARPRISASMQEGHLAYTVTWVNNLGHTVATLRRKLSRHEDGALELYRHSAWVDPDHRNHALSARVWMQESALLSSLSKHPKTRMSLWAGAVKNPKKHSEAQAIGVYLWARLGFDYADAHGSPSSLARNVDRPRCEGDAPELGHLELARRQMMLWVDERIAADELPKDPEVRGRIERAVGNVRHPWQLAALAVEGLRVEQGEGERKSTCDLGKAFMLSSRAPRWEGVFFVSAPDSAASSAAVAYAQTALQRATSGEAAHERELELLLSKAKRDPTELAAAVEHIGLVGGEQWAKPLRALRSGAKDDPDLLAAIDTAIARVRGEWKPPRPKIEWVARPAGGVDALPSKYQSLESDSADALLEHTRSDDRFLAEAALTILRVKIGGEDPKRVESAARELYLRMAHDDHWMIRKGAVNVLGQLPDEAGVPALIELMAKEDDINVLIAGQRWLQQAETPVAEAPTEALGRRIEAMKEEIERALAEL